MARFLSILFLITVFTIDSVGVNADSLLKVIRFSKDDSLRIEAQLSYAKSFFTIGKDSSIAMQQRALLLSEQNNYRTLECKLLEQLGISYRKLSNYTQALSYFNEANLKLQKGNDSSSIARVKFYLGLCYNEMGDYNNSIDSYYQALELYEKLNDTLSCGRLLNNIGVNLSALNEYRDAYNHYLQAFEYKLALDDYEGIVNSYINLGNIMLKLENSDSSLYYHELGFQGAKILNNKRLIIESLNCKGNAFIENDKPSEAIKQYQNALDRFKGYTNNYQLSQTYNGLAKAYFLDGNIFQAKEIIKKNIFMLEVNGSMQNLKNAYLLLSQIYLEEGNYRLAYDAINNYSIAKDSIYNSEKLAAFAEMQEKYKSEKNLKEIESLRFHNQMIQLQKDKHQAYLLSSVLGISVLLVFLFLAIYLYRKRQHANDLLSQSLTEKEVLLKEVHHRVKNNFQLISSLLNLQTGIITDKTAIDALTESRNRIESMALVHKNLYLTDNLSFIKVEHYLKQLVESIVPEFINGKTKINYGLQIGDFSFNIDTLVPLGLMVNELLSNSIKYAFNDLDEGCIILKLRHVDDRKYEFIYSDNGCGMPPEIDLDNLESLGLELVQLLVAQLEGTLECSSENGLKFRILFNSVV